MQQGNDVMVSICCATYNHAPCIRQCLEGFVMQRTNFKFEVLIHDDASTDGTADIIREYEAKYPSIIKPIYQTENQYSKGMSISATFNWPRAKGKYIAQCEGDDYWIDPLKLQKQVDLLESNINCSLCCTGYMIKYLDGKQKEVSKGRLYIFDLNEWLKGWITKTLTVMLRASMTAEYQFKVKSNYKYYRDAHLFII